MTTDFALTALAPDAAFRIVILDLNFAAAEENSVAGLACRPVGLWIFTVLAYKGHSFPVIGYGLQAL